jgi:hypothetical protein
MVLQHLLHVFDLDREVFDSLRKDTHLLTGRDTGELPVERIASARRYAVLLFPSRNAGYAQSDQKTVAARGIRSF